MQQHTAAAVSATDQVYERRMASSATAEHLTRNMWSEQGVRQHTKGNDGIAIRRIGVFIRSHQRHQLLGLQRQQHEYGPAQLVQHTAVAGYLEQGAALRSVAHEAYMH